MLSPRSAGKHPGVHPTYTDCADRAQKETAGLTPLCHFGDLPRELCLFVISRHLCLPKSPRSHGHMCVVQLVQASSWPKEAISRDSGSRRAAENRRPGILPSQPRLTLHSLRAGPTSQVCLGCQVEVRTPYKALRSFVQDRAQGPSRCDTAGKDRRERARPGQSVFGQVELSVGNLARSAWVLPRLIRQRADRSSKQHHPFFKLKLMLEKPQRRGSSF